MQCLLKYALFGVTLCVFAYCKEQPATTTLTLSDSLNIIKKSDSTTQSVIKDALFDTAGLSQAPVKVLTAKLVAREYSNSKDIRLTWKNVSDKHVAAIRFKWYGLNAFGEPADMGASGVLKGMGTGYVDRRLNPGNSDSGEWDIMSNDGKKIILAWPYEVAFEDGTQWKCGK